jgi:hypothetical protein
MRVIAMLVVLLCAMTAYADVSVAVGSAHDEAGANDQLLRDAVVAQLSASPQLTARGAQARRVDVRVVAVRSSDCAAGVAMTAQLEIVISDAAGKMMSVMTNSAKTEVSRSSYQARFSRLRRQLIEDAVQGMFGKLRSHLLASA